MADLNERSIQDFLIYANSVIKSRAIPRVEDNLKPIHRKILWTLYEDKVFADKPTKKCATEAGRALAYSPHGDASVYGAMVRLSQWWKLRYPLMEMQGNCGNILGDTAAASRYTECRLSPLGMLMLEDINKNCVDFRPNYDNTTTEPETLPSKFPFLLCGNNSGIAVGMGSDIVSHNFTEVMGAIQYYMEHKDCSIADLMQFIKGPDFPTGGKIINGEELLKIYTEGVGSVKVCAHYDISKNGANTIITFHDLPYGVEIDDGVKKPLKKLVIEDGNEAFEDINVTKVGPRNFDIAVTLAKGANVAACLQTLFNKTKLMSSIKINQNFIVDGEPRVLSLKDMIVAWVNYRHKCITKIAQTDYDKTNHKLTITLGLQKCMSNIDRVIQIVRFDDTPKATLMKEFSLNDEQATAILDIKLARLSRLEVEKLNSDEKILEETLAALKNIIDNESVREQMILADLQEIKKILGEDKRLTEISYAQPVAGVTGTTTPIKQEFKVTNYGNIYSDTIFPSSETLVGVVSAYRTEDVFGYTKAGEMAKLTTESLPNCVGASGRTPEKDRLVAVTRNGNVKVSMLSEYKLGKHEKVMKVKEDDELLFMAFCNENDFLFLTNGSKVLKLALKDWPVASKNTVGLKSGMSVVVAAAVATDGDNLLFVTGDMKGKLTAAKDFSVDNRGNKGQTIAENTVTMLRLDPTREQLYMIPKLGKMFTVARSKVSLKGRTAQGVSLTTRAVDYIC